MSLIPIRGIRLNVNTLGQGYPIILVHGVGRDHTQYDFVIKNLARNFRTITPDCRGHGLSDKPVEYTLQDHVDDILAIMDYYQIEEAHLLGISGGSYIAQGIAIAAPHRISKLILTVPKSNGRTSSMQRLIDLHRAELDHKDPKEKAAALLKYFTYDSNAIKKNIHLFETTLTPTQFTAADKALSRFDFRRDLPKITAKTLVISGKYDGLNPPQKGKEVARLVPDSRYVEISYSGHLPMAEEPDAYLKIVEQFMLENS